MDFHLLTDVRQFEREPMGELRHVIYRAETGEVVSIVVEQGGFDGHAVVVPIEAVQSADDDATYLDLTPEQLAGMPVYAVGRNIAPPPDAANVDEDEITDPVNVPDVPAIGAAAGIESIAFTPIIEVTRDLPEGTVNVSDQTVVAATDGDIGHVTHVLVSDQTHRITGFIVERGTLFQHSAEIPAEWVTRIEQDRIVLRVDKATAEAPTDAGA